MTNSLRTRLQWFRTAVVLLLCAQRAAADNCSGPGDCFGTAQATLVVGALALMVGLLALSPLTASGLVLTRVGITAALRWGIAGLAAGAALPAGIRVLEHIADGHISRAEPPPDSGQKDTQSARSAEPQKKPEDPEPEPPPPDPFTTGAQPKASEIERWAKAKGWTRVQKSATAPPRYVDQNGVTRVVLKQGSPRTPGSESPHVELRNELGQRIDPKGNAVTRRSVGNHTPIEWDIQP